MLTVFSVTDNFYISNNKLNWLSTSQDIKKIFNLLEFQISHEEIPLTAHELKKNNITEFFQLIVHFSIRAFALTTILCSTYYYHGLYVFLTSWSKTQIVALCKVTQIMRPEFWH